MFVDASSSCSEKINSTRLFFLKQKKRRVVELRRKPRRRRKMREVSSEQYVVSRCVKTALSPAARYFSPKNVVVG